MLNVWPMYLHLIHLGSFGGKCKYNIEHLGTVHKSPKRIAFRFHEIILSRWARICSRSLFQNLFERTHFFGTVLWMAAIQPKPSQHWESLKKGGVVLCGNYWCDVDSRNTYRETTCLSGWWNILSCTVFFIACFRFPSEAIFDKSFQVAYFPYTLGIQPWFTVVVGKPFFTLNEIHCEPNPC